MRQIEREPVTAQDRGEDLGRFAAAHGQSLMRFAYLLTQGHRASAEDLVQGVLARLAGRGLAGLDDPLAYARRCIVNEHRSQARHTQVHCRTAPRLVVGEVATDAGAGTEDRLAILDALEVLRPRERAAVLLRYYEDLPDEQIAEVLGCSRATVRSLIHRATRKLRHALAGTFDARRAPAPSVNDWQGTDE